MTTANLTKGRLKEAMEEAGFRSIELADAIGISQSAVSQILSGKTANSRHLPKIADLLNVPLPWLLGTSDTKELERDEGFYAEIVRDMDAVLIPEVDIRYGMGGGFADDFPQGTPVAFPREWLRPLIRETFDQLFLARLTGNSMEPTMSANGVVVVDSAQNIVNQQDSVWCLALGEVVMVKRIRRHGDGRYEIISDNPAVESQSADDQEVHVIGRVIWYGEPVS